MDEFQVIGREAELESIRSFIKTRLDDLKGGSLYVCGKSGTGKTAVTKQVYASLERVLEERQERGGDRRKRTKTLDPDFRLGWFVGAQSSPLLHQMAQALVHNVADAHLEEVLESCFSRTDRMHVLVVDELDLVPKDTVRKLFTWAQDGFNLILVGIANIVNAPLNLLNQANLKLEELPFAPYDAKQLESIVLSKLGHRAARFKQGAIEISARKVAAKSGDVRRIMELCERALDHVPPSEHVTVRDVMNQAKSSNAIQIQSLATQQVFALVACVRGSVDKKETSAEGVDEKEVRKAWTRLRDEWQVRVEGNVKEHLEALVQQGLVSESVSRARNRGSSKTETRRYRVLVSQQDLLTALTEGEEESTLDLALSRPIVRALQGVKVRAIANLHATGS